jgi:hypothetical protein
MPKGLREILNKMDDINAHYAFYYFDTSDNVAETVIRLLLNEDKSRVDLGQNKSIIFHRAHTEVNQDHLHFLVKGDKIAAVNRDGTAHDSSHGVRLQKWALNGAAQHYPEFRMPKDGLIERLMVEAGAQMLNEEIGGANVLIPRAVITEAISHASGS